MIQKIMRTTVFEDNMSQDVQYTETCVSGKPSDIGNVINDFTQNDRMTIAIQGLGFVGSAMAAALSSTINADGDIVYNILGVELPNKSGLEKALKINRGLSPIQSEDTALDMAFERALGNNNLLAVTDPAAFSQADIVIIDVNLDITKTSKVGNIDYHFSYDTFRSAIKTVAEHIKADTLVLIETTVPPGTTEKVAYPIFAELFAQRGLDINQLKLGFSYERVMPGSDYLNSIKNYYRVYSGVDQKSKDSVRRFLESFINTADYPLTELASCTAVETAKTLENSFRAMNIAFIQEWTDLAHRSGVNLYEVIDAIRMRSTHRNIMYPGLGVGGYCLTKDSLLADWANMNHFDAPKHLEMSLNAIAVNDLMPEFTFNLLNAQYPDLSGKKVAVLGVSYRPDVADTRNTPVSLVYDKLDAAGAEIILYDDLLTYWPEKELGVYNDLTKIGQFQPDIVIFAVSHRKIKLQEANTIMDLFASAECMLDANNILSEETARHLHKQGIKMIGTGKGHWQNWS